jgi:DNA-binding HxlR family transcriptional regulator
MNEKKTMHFSIENDPYQHIIRVMCNRWKPYLIRALEFEAEKYSRFSTFTKQLPITKKVLSRNLKELEDDGIIYKTIYPEVPPRVEYRLTEIGKSLCPILDIMYSWAWHDMKRKNMEIDPLGEMWHGFRDPNEEIMRDAYKK